MNLFDQDAVTRFRKLMSDLRWASAAPMLNVPGKPFSFSSTDMSVSLRGPFGSAPPSVVIQAPTLTDQVRQELNRRGWVYAVNGATFVVSVGRYLRQPVGVFQQVTGGPVVTASPDDTSKGEQRWVVGQSEFKYPRDTLA